jgi:hypothetical protein
MLKRQTDLVNENKNERRHESETPSEKGKEIVFQE